MDWGYLANLNIIGKIDERWTQEPSTDTLDIRWEGI
jgi:hypothetical protein